MSLDNELFITKLTEYQSVNLPLFDPPTVFYSKRLQMRCYRRGDGAVYFRAVSANWEHLYEFLPPPLMSLQSAEGAEAWIRKMAADWQARQLFVFSVWEKESGDYIGETYLANPDWKVPCIELGYFVLAGHTGKGFATEAARATTHFAFEHLGVSRVELQCAADNLASRRVAERCGFVYEGHMRGRNRKKDGALVDRLWYGILRSEWDIDKR